MPPATDDFIAYTPPSPHATGASVSQRDHVRTRLRAELNGKLDHLAGTQTEDAHMSWTPSGYAADVVARYRYKLVGWPADIPFCNLSDIRGGVQPLQRLYNLWEAGSLRFEEATDDDVADAQVDPMSVHPNLPHPDSPQEERTASEPVIVASTVLEPGSLATLGDHLTCTQPSALTVGERPARQQRCDVKKARRRPVTNPDNAPLRRPKPGVKSARYAVDVDVEESEIEEYESSGEGPSQHGPGYWLTDDPIEEFV